MKRRRSREQDEATAREQAEDRREALLAELKARLGPQPEPEAEAEPEADAEPEPASEPDTEPAPAGGPDDTAESART